MDPKPAAGCAQAFNPDQGRGSQLNASNMGWVPNGFPIIGHYSEHSNSPPIRLSLSKNMKVLRKKKNYFGIQTAFKISQISKPRLMKQVFVSKC